MRHSFVHRRVASIIGVLVVLSGYTIGCKRIPSETEIPAAEILPIDGDYECVVLSQRVPVVVDRGRIYARDTKQIVARNIKQLTPTTYSCESILVIAGSFDRFVPARLTVISDDRFLVETPPAGGSKGAADVFYRVVDGKTSFPESSNEAAMSGISVALDDAEKLIPGKPEIVTVAPGSKAILKRSHTIEHEVTLMFDASVEATMRGETGVVISPLYKLSGEVKLRLERQLGRSFKDSETIEQSVEVDGNANRRYQLTWVDRVRTGHVKFTIDGKTSEVPFVFREWAELNVEAFEPHSSGASTTS